MSRPYLDHLPGPLQPGSIERVLGPPRNITFEEYDQDTIFQLLNQWISGQLPESCPVPVLDVYGHWHTSILGHFGRLYEDDQRPIWCISHQISSPRYPIEADHSVHHAGYWAAKYTTDIRKNNVLVGHVIKLKFYEKTYKGSLRLTTGRMEQYFLPNDRYPPVIGTPPMNKFGGWFIAKMYMKKKQTRRRRRRM